MYSKRARIRYLLQSGEKLYVSQIARKLGLSPAAVARSVSALAQSGDLLYEKEPGKAYRRYYLNPELRDLTFTAIKLAQLRTHKDAIRKLGVTTIDQIIHDYERLPSVLAKLTASELLD